MTFRDLLAVVRRHTSLSLAVLLICLGAGAAAALLPKRTYSASATLIVQPKAATGGDSFGAVEAARFLQPALADLVETRSFKGRVQTRVPPDAAGRRAVLKGEPEVGSPILRVSAETHDQSVADTWANAAAQELIATNPSPLVDITVLDPARRPTSPSGPLRVPILLGSSILGVILAVFAALAADGLRRRLRGVEELRERFGIEVLGEIPRIRNFPAHPADMLKPGADPAVLEAYQRLRTNFELLLLNNQLPSVAITSFGSGEGKTSVTANLAWGIAALGQEVVAVDGDLRRPRLHEALDVDGRGGVGGMKPRDDVRAVCQPTAMPGLAVLPAGSSNRHPTELIATTFPRVLGALEASDRFTIVDSPPLVVAETVLLAAMTRSVVLVVDVGQRDPDDIGEALAELRQAGANVLGVVLNRSKRRSRRRGAEYYYQHRPQQKLLRSGKGPGRKPTSEPAVETSAAPPRPGPPGTAQPQAHPPKTPDRSGDKTDSQE